MAAGSKKAKSEERAYIVPFPGRRARSRRRCQWRQLAGLREPDSGETSIQLCETRLSDLFQQLDEGVDRLARDVRGALAAAEDLVTPRC